MKIFSLIMLLLLYASCSSHNSHGPINSPQAEMNISETLHAHDLLLNIMDRKIEPLPCIEDPEEAGIFLKALDPHYEEVLDSYQAKLDDDKEVQKMVLNCENDCNCLFIKSLLEENEIQIEKAVKKNLKLKISSERFISCSKKMTSHFCESSIYKMMEQEKSEFNSD